MKRRIIIEVDTPDDSDHIYPPGELWKWMNDRGYQVSRIINEPLEDLL